MIMIKRTPQTHIQTKTAKAETQNCLGKNNKNRFTVNLPGLTAELGKLLTCELTVGKKTVEFLIENFEKSAWR